MRELMLHFHYAHSLFRKKKKQLLRVPSMQCSSDLHGTCWGEIMNPIIPSSTFLLPGQPRVWERAQFSFCRALGALSCLNGAHDNKSSTMTQTQRPLYQLLAHRHWCLLLYGVRVCIHAVCSWAFIRVLKIHVGCWDSIICPTVSQHPF